MVADDNSEIYFAEREQGPSIRHTRAGHRSLPRQDAVRPPVLNSEEGQIATEQFTREHMAMKGNTAPQITGLTKTAADLNRETTALTEALRKLLADVFTLYMKTKNFHWHMNGKHFRDYHLLLDEQASQIFAMTDDIAERARKIGVTTLHSISDIALH
jgi:hypothetical protein